MTDAETRVLARTAAVLLVVSATRYGWEVHRGPPLLTAAPDDLSGLLEGSLRLRQENQARGRPLDFDERIDSNLATEIELDRLPGIGPAAARAIVTSREKDGPFAAADDLLRVPGIGAATLQRIAGHLELAPAGPGPGLASRARPGGAPGLAARAPARPPLDLNRATAGDLEGLPGVGPVLAARILTERTRRGAFRSPDDLLEVKGIGLATLDRLRPLVRAGGP